MRRKNEVGLVDDIKNDLMCISLLFKKFAQWFFVIKRKFTKLARTWLNVRLSPFRLIHPDFLSENQTQNYHFHTFLLNSFLK